MSSNIFLHKIVDTFNTKYTYSEISLNLIFLVIVITLFMILYWDSINQKVNRLSRCKRQMNIYNNKEDSFIIEASSKSKERLFDITYDINQKNTNVECKCESGNFVNEFNNISVRDLKKNKNVKVNKTCTCDKYYNTGMQSENVIYSGEPGILRYMKTDNSDFFDNLVYATYNN